MTVIPYGNYAVFCFPISLFSCPVSSELLYAAIVFVLHPTFPLVLTVSSVSAMSVFINVQISDSLSTLVMLNCRG